MEISKVEYLEEVESIAKEVIREAMEQADNDQEEALDLINDYLLHESIDDHQWIIYYAYNLDVYQHSDNPDYCVDNFGADVVVHALKESGMNGLHQAVAFWSLYADVMDKIHSILEE